MNESITLTRREIFDLAKAANLIPWNKRFLHEADTEYTICGREGGIEIEDDDKQKSKYAHGAYLTDYPDEGTFPLGDKLT